MSAPVRMALALGPLAAYFFVLGVWQSGRRPRVVSGSLDFALLSAGLGCLVAFGPVGEWAVGLAFRGPSLWAWLAMASLVILATLIGLPRASRRLVVYHVRAEDLERAVGQAMEGISGPVERTLHGFEARGEGRGVTVEARLRSGVVEGHGVRPEALIASLLRELPARLGKASPPATSLGAVLFALATVTMGLGLILGRWPQYRAILERIVGR